MWCNTMQQLQYCAILDGWVAGWVAIAIFTRSEQILSLALIRSTTGIMDKIVAETFIGIKNAMIARDIFIILVDEDRAK